VYVVQSKSKDEVIEISNGKNTDGKIFWDSGKIVPYENNLTK